MKARLWLLTALVAGCVDLTLPGQLAQPEESDGGTRLVRDAGWPDQPEQPVILVSSGKPCASAKQCQSGACVDGVCCSTACGDCEACNLPGSEGSCAPVPAGQDPGNDCAAESAATCGQDGTCDGQGRCRRYPAGSECVPGACLDRTEYAARVCDGQGTCGTGASRACGGGGSCLSGSCGARCSSPADCQTGFFCDAGTCRAKHAIAVACTTSLECASGFCVDGVCCSSACAEPCFACSVTGSVGVCSPEPAGQDARKICPAEPAASCGRAGGCNGQGACALHAPGTTCLPSACAGNTAQAASACDGLGTCVAGGSTACGDYLCAGGACPTSCTSSAQCATGSACGDGKCSAPGLVIDDFSDGTIGTNRLGGTVSWDNQNCSITSGQLVCSWNGSNVFQDLIFTFRKDWCEYNAKAYGKVRFRMRASTAGKKVEVHFGVGNGSCSLRPLSRIATISLTTTMATYEASIAALARDKAISIEFDPADVDATKYYLDDLQLVP